MRLKRPAALMPGYTFWSKQHYRQRFLEEAQLASVLTGADVAEIYEVVEENGEILLVMEYVEG